MNKSTKYTLIAGLIGIVAAIIGALGVGGVFTVYDDTVDGEFSIDEEYYRHIIDGGKLSVEAIKRDAEYFGKKLDLSDNVGSVDSAAAARKAAVKVWNEIYGKHHIEGEKPYKVKYDAEHEVWHVNGTLHGASLGGVAEILIEKNGKIIAVWHGK